MYSAKPVSGNKSFDEMEDDQLKYFATLTPEELFCNLKKLSMSAYGYKIGNEKNIDRKIKFKKIMKLKKGNL